MRALNERSLRAIVKSNWSGTAAAFEKATLAPAVEKFRTWQSIVDLRRLNAMVPPRQVRARSLFRLSIIARLQFRFAGQNIIRPTANNRSRQGEFALILNQWVNCPSS